jgi:hypothetical protein
VKNLNCLFILIIISIFFGSCASTSPLAKSALKDIEDIDISRIPRENNSYLKVAEFVTILSIDGQKDNSNFIIPGFHTLVVRYSEGYSYSDNIPILHNFEGKKNYLLHYEIEKEGNFDPNTIKFFISEITIDERIESFLTYMETNKNHLDGTWERVHLLNRLFSQLIFEGNKLKLIEENKTIKRQVEMKGEIFFNETTIIFLPITTIINGKEDNNSDFNKNRYITYYSIKNNILKLEGTTFFSTGEYVKAK